MTSSPRALAGLGCLRHRWCVRESVVPARDGSPVRFHHGAPTAIRAGDDMVTVALVSTEDLDAVSYVEVETVTRGGQEQPASVWLTADEACTLLAAVASTLGESSAPVRWG